MRALEPFGFDLEPVVYSPGPFGRGLPEAAPRVIVADAAPRVTVKHFDLLLLLSRRWEGVPRIAVTATRDPRILSAFRTLGVREFASESNGGTYIAARLWRHLDDGGALSRRGADERRGIDCDAVRHTVSANGRSVPLSTREFELFTCLAQRPNAMVPRSEIARRVWGERTTTRSWAVGIGVCVFHLRRKLAILGMEHAVRTVRGKGYMLIDAEAGPADFGERHHGMPD